jgi:hypothetical protein
MFFVWEPDIRALGARQGELGSGRVGASRRPGLAGDRRAPSIRFFLLLSEGLGGNTVRFHHRHGA